MLHIETSINAALLSVATAWHQSTYNNWCRVCCYASAKTAIGDARAGWCRRSDTGCGSAPSSAPPKPWVTLVTDAPIRRHRIGCRDRRLEDIFIGAAILRPGLGFGAEAAHDRRQGQARQHHQAGQSILAVVTDRRRNGRHPLRAQARNAEATVARPVDGAPTHESSCRRPRQQDCVADGLGHHVRGERYKEPELLLAA